MCVRMRCLGRVHYMDTTWTEGLLSALKGAYGLAYYHAFISCSYMDALARACEGVHARKPWSMQHARDTRMESLTPSGPGLRLRPSDRPSQRRKQRRPGTNSR